MLGILKLRNKRANLAVSEIIGTLIILGIVTSSFSVVFFSFNSNTNPVPTPIVDLAGMIEDNQIILSHRGGEPLDLNTDLVLDIGGQKKSFKVGDFLDDKSKEDGVWSLGENIVYPLNYDFDYSIYPQVGLNIIDENSNSIVLMGTTDISPVCDIGIDLSVNKSNPRENENVLFTVKVTNYANINASGIIINVTLPDVVSYISSEASQGTYTNSNGLWNVQPIMVASYATLNITAKLSSSAYHQKTQFVVILDGSGSIDSASWKLACDGLINNICDESLFPRDGTVELTIVQVGVDLVCARAEIGPVVVNSSNINTIKDQIIELKNKQGKGWTPIAAGFYLANYIITNSTNFGGFNTNNRQVILLVSDGNSDVKVNQGYFYGEKVDIKHGEIYAKNARDYLIHHVKMTEDKDEIEVISVNPRIGQLPINKEFLCEDIVWPQPCYDSTPTSDYNDTWPPPGPGWYRFVQSWQEFSNTLNETFSVIFNNILVKAYIASSAFSDPKIVNDESHVKLKPTQSSADTNKLIEENNNLTKKTAKLEKKYLCLVNRIENRVIKFFSKTKPSHHPERRESAKVDKKFIKLLKKIQSKNNWQIFLPYFIPNDYYE